MATDEQAARGGQGERQFDFGGGSETEECGAEHTGCPNEHKGRCRRPVHPSGEYHRCDECQSEFL